MCVYIYIYIYTRAHIYIFAGRGNTKIAPSSPLLLPRCPAQHNLAMWVVTLYQKMLRVFFFFLNVWAMHRDPDFWNNPSEFRPERFLGDAIILENLWGVFLMWENVNSCVGFIVASLGVKIAKWNRAERFRKSWDCFGEINTFTCYSNLELYTCMHRTRRY